MRKYRSELSAVVLERRRKINQRRLENLAMFLPMFVLLAGTAVAVRDNYVKAEAERKLAAEQAAPTWASFVAAKADAPMAEYITATDDEGIPHQLIINGESWDITQVNHFDDIDTSKPGAVLPDRVNEAETDCENRNISYIKGPKNNLRINLMHEVFHAGACLHGGDEWWNSIHPTNSVHPGIYHLGDFMSNFVHDNPLFMQWEMQ